MGPPEVHAHVDALATKGVQWFLVQGEVGSGLGGWGMCVWGRGGEGVGRSRVQWSTAGKAVAQIA